MNYSIWLTSSQETEKSRQPLSKSAKSLMELRGIFVGEAIDQVPTIGHIASEHLVDGLERGGFQSDGTWEK
jgi:hypothetical protein